MKKVSIVTLGCKVNQVESENIAEELEKLGYSVSMGLNEADIYIINTCAVTNEAERKSRNIITKLLKINPNSSIYVCGCASHNNADNFKKSENVKDIIGNYDKNALVKSICKNDPTENKPQKNNVSRRVTERTRAILWAQNGCNNFCTYCLIPYLRGRETSFPLADLEKEVRKLEKIANEIVITGINLSSYGNDIEGSDGLIEVARLFKNSPSRFRFSSLEVNVISDKFLSELATFENFCDQFHLSLQSGGNNTLKSMNRHYTKEQYLEKVELIRKYFPNAGITTDIIIGFPTETEDDFNESLEFVKSVNFFEMHVFPYSKRNGTVAEKFKNIATNVPERVKKMTEAANAMKQEFLKKNVGLIHEVIIETKKENYYLAHTKNYILCYIESNEELAPNSKVNVKILTPYADGATAKIV
ncbi:MAG: tRNA (N(6)-L-threonylcarbamoyladenosine(37)-C(2))-methylthiotransferase MtaB [Clostridiales bacterium]|nr:tRNA (N(6)-L-threonylcarbamoyladenosine(37)-C(2))-methylthiotransferase MtaB [Clostridiales bacterium]